MNNDYETIYNVGLFDDLHNFLPAILYDRGRFQTLPDLLGYVHTQAQYHFNIFNRGTQRYQRQPAPQRAATITTRDTIDITPLFTAQMNRPLAQHGITAILHPQTGDTTFTFPTPEEGDAGTTPALDVIMNIIQGGGLGRNRIMEPVIVRPTLQQIDTATSQRTATSEDETDNCTICQDLFTEGQIIRQINHCHHNFHRNCINPWFEQHVHCPVCRFDIRETT